MHNLFQKIDERKLSNSFCEASTTQTPKPDKGNIKKKKKKKTTEEEEEKPGCACGDRMVLYLDSSNVSHFVVALYYSFTRKLYLEKLWLGTLGGQDSGYTGSLHRVSFFLFFFRNYLFLSF